MHNQDRTAGGVSCRLSCRPVGLSRGSTRRAVLWNVNRSTGNVKSHYSAVPSLLLPAERHFGMSSMKYTGYWTLRAISCPTMKHTAIYLRVSSKQQDLKSQEIELGRYAAGLDGQVAWYRDKFTGKTMDRPGWKKLEAAMVRGDVSAIACWRLDRLGRTAKGLAALFEELHQRKVNLVSLNDGINLETPAGRMIANVLASLAQYETEVRAERVIAGQAAARGRGQEMGWICKRAEAEGDR